MAASDKMRNNFSTKSSHYESTSGVPDTVTANAEYGARQSQNESTVKSKGLATENWSPDAASSGSIYGIKRKPIPGRRSTETASSSFGSRTDTTASFGQESSTRAESLSENETKLEGDPAESLHQSDSLPIRSKIEFSSIQNAFSDARVPVTVQLSNRTILILAIFVLALWLVSGSYLNEPSIGLTPASPIIALMGETGAGKSSFIRALNGLDANGQPPVIGHSLDSTTKAVTWYSAVVKNRGFYLIDTPGFDDTYASDFEILEVVAKELARVYQEQRPLTGIVYIHDISKEKMGKVSKKTLETFQRLVGETSLKSVVLTTSHWNSYFFRELQEKRETELHKKFWNHMIQRRSKVARWDGSTKSARRIVEDIINSKPIILKIVDEMVNKQKDVSDTEAGDYAAEGWRKLENQPVKKPQSLEWRPWSATSWIFKTLTIIVLSLPCLVIFVAFLVNL